MAKFKAYDYRQRVFLPVSLEDQLMAGTLEFAIQTLVETRLDTSGFERQAAYRHGRNSGGQTGHAHQKAEEGLYGGRPSAPLSIPGDYPTHGARSDATGMYGCKITDPQPPRSATYLRHPAADGPLFACLCAETVGPSFHQHDRRYLRPLGSW
jgi:hypothetical protein